MKDHIGIYPGSFDPVTLGHLDIVDRASKIFDKVIVAVLRNPNKQVTFSIDDRIEMLNDSLKSRRNIEVDSFDGLLIDYLKKRRGRSIIRGLRMISDFENEFQMALINRKMSPDFETVFLMTTEEFSFLSSSLIKEIYMLGGDVSPFVPKLVLKKLKIKFR